MGAKAPVRQFDLAQFAATLLAEREVNSRARRILGTLDEYFPDSAFALYVCEESEPGPSWRVRATEGDIRVDAHAMEQLEAFRSALTAAEPVVYDGAALSREAYAHLDLRRTVTSWAFVPLHGDSRTVAVIEVVAFSEPLTDRSFTGLAQLLDIAGTGISSALIYESERNSQLSSISRITQFYDLEKTFNSSIDIEELLPLIASKFREILNAQAVNLWMVADKETLLLTNRAGEDFTRPLESSQTKGSGIAFDVSDSGEPVLIDDSDDERLTLRNRDVPDGKIFSLMAVPLKDREECVGIAEVINKSDGLPFDDDDLFLLSTIAETASGALHNAGLLQTERKAQVLEALVEVSNEITSTLNLDRVLQSVVNGAQAVIPFERSAIALEQTGRLRLKAVSGMRQINYGEPSLVRLRDLVEWLSFARDELYVVQKDEEITGVSDEYKAQFRDYFAATGARTFYARPLTDDQGQLGLLTYESSEPHAFNTAHLELIKILAGQATVALRNAQLYQEVPFINVLEPILERKRRFLRMQKRRRAAVLAATAVALLFLIFVPIPLRVEGDATVAPMRTAQIQPEFDGVIKRVLVHEGEAVQRGTVVAEMEDFDVRKALAEANAKYNTALAEMNRALAANDGTTAGMQRAQVAYWSAEKARAQDRLQRMQLKSPIDGVVTTPFVENFAGRKLEAGDKFAEVIDTSKATVDVAVEEQDIGLIRSGMSAGVKLDSYPMRTFRGNVVIVSPKGEAREDERVFFARVEVPNPEGRVRAGMQGQSKVMTGWRPAGYVLFRRTGMWAWGKLWSWFGF